jgi:uncharacterized protein (DUF305 family)
MSKLILAGAAFAATLLAHTVAFSRDDDYYAQLDEAMARMHRDMHVRPSGDVDRDFARMMVPHHQGAIDMALLELRFGREPRLRRLAQEIIITQQQEIRLMTSILEEG